MNKEQFEDSTLPVGDLIDDAAIRNYFFAPDACPDCGTTVPKQSKTYPCPTFSCNCANPPRFLYNGRMALRLAGRINRCEDHRFLLRLTFDRQLELYDFKQGAMRGTGPYAIAACIDGAHEYVIAKAAMHIMELRREDDGHTERAEAHPGSREADPE